VNGRRLILRNATIRDRAAEIVAGLPVSEEKPLEVLVRPYQKRRSLAQNSLYWKWVDAIRLHIIDSTGKRFSKDEVHEWLAAEFLPTRVVEIAGKAKATRTSTARLSTKEMVGYLEAIEHWAGADLQCYLEHPADLWLEAMGMAT
jgi:hypothetical protein